MINPKVEENKLRKHLVFDDRITSLKNIFEAATDHFPGIDCNELYFEMPDFGNEYDDLILGKLPNPHFIEHDGDFSSKIYPFCSLAQVKKQAESSPDWNGDFSKVRLFWFKGELCMEIKKHQYKTYEERCFSGLVD